jgi:D-aminoacyl-tRNA deacylase
MIAVVQRVSRASVTIDGQIAGAIDAGLVALVAVHREDGPEDVAFMAGKLTQMRVFPAEGKTFDRDVQQVGGSILLISNFTVAAATRKGRRPALDAAADPQTGGRYFHDLLAAVAATGVPVQTGVFAAHMLVTIDNDGPVTFIVDSKSDK